MELLNDWQQRTKLLLKEKYLKLEKSHVLVVGLGGVGAMAAEMLVRAGIGTITLVDFDRVNLSNLNRQIFTTTENLNQKKVEVAKKRLISINPSLNINIFDFYLKDEVIDKILDMYAYDYIVDAIDTIAPKVYLLYQAYNKGFKIVSSMGAGGRLDCSKVKVDDISKSFNCPLARHIRKRLHRLGIYKGIKVVFSYEKTTSEALEFVDLENKKTTLGTISYLPNLFGILAASTVINDLIGSVEP